MKRVLAVFAAIISVNMFLLLWLWATKPTGSEQLEQLRAKFKEKETPSVDHTKFEQLQKKFSKPQDVTAACLSCHNGRHIEVMQSNHWQWQRVEYVEGKGIRALGKKDIMNNNCIGISTNEQSCNKCHAGYGWSDETFDFNNPLNIDCLSCHDNSNTYVKATGGAGLPDPSVNLNVAAQSVGRPTRSNCGTCHFYGGGGNNVKHGDLEESLFTATRELDVHLAVDGANLECVDCHTTRKHMISGKLYSISSMNRNRVTCEQCHTSMPHGSTILNEHTVKVACQTCHIPVYAKENPTKIYWDWSTAGRLKDGQPYAEKDSLGMESYLSIKGTFVWARNIKPEYRWFNGTASHYLIGDTIASVPLQMNTLYGSYDDPESRIIPVKIMRGKQIYDTQYKYLIQPKTVSTHAGDGGFWKEFNWQRAAEEGMKRLQLPFSGSYDFVETEMYWPVNHMVSPKEQTVQCRECHTRNNGRLAELKGFYIPGRDYNPIVETAGNILIILTLLSVFVHGTLRIIASKKTQSKREQ